MDRLLAHRFGFRFALSSFAQMPRLSDRLFPPKQKHKGLSYGFAAVLAGVLWLAPLTANSQGCTQSQIDGDFAMVCTSAFGDSEGLYVDKVGVAADIFEAHTCNGIFEAWAEQPNGKMWRERGRAKCGFGRVWVNFSAKRKFKDGAKLCGAIVTPRGKVRPEHACIEIHK